MLTWTALRRRSIGPFETGGPGGGRTGSIQPCAAEADEMVHRKTMAANTRDVRMDCTWLGTPERRRPPSELHSPKSLQAVSPKLAGSWSLSYRTLVGAGLQHFCVCVREFDQSKIGFFDGAISVRKVRRVIRDPL